MAHFHNANGDLPASIFSLCILGARDMNFLWTRLDAIAKQHGVLSAGDTACCDIWSNESVQKIKLHGGMAPTCSSIQIAKAIVASNSHYHAGIAAARTAIDLMENANRGGLLRIAPNESHWLGHLRETLDEMPDSEEEFISQQLARADPSKFLPAEYGL